jgi:N-acetylneuraminate lyase
MPICIVAAPPTAFDDRHRIELGHIDKFAEHLAQSGVGGVFLCGSTGEGLSLSVAERKEVAEAWSAVAPVHGLRVLVQVGATSQADAIELARHASTLSVEAISALAPCYFRPRSVEQLIDFFEPIAAAGNGLPFYFYDIPQLTHVELPTAKFLRQAKSRIPTLEGVKYTNPNLAQLQECLRLDDHRYQLFYGCDEALLAGYALGAQSAIGSTYNIMAPLANSIIASFDAGDLALARERQAKVIELVNLLDEYGYLAALKSALKLYGIDFGGVRAPLVRLTSKEETELLERLRLLGMPFDYQLAVQSHQPAAAVHPQPVLRGAHWTTKSTSGR